MSKILLRTFAVALLLFSQSLSADQQSADLQNAELPNSERPNIIVIMADDMGFSDIGCYGSEIPTPNLDSLAQRGVRFTDFYNTSRCCLSRASILTGLYPHQTGMGGMNYNDTGRPGYRAQLMPDVATIPEVLKTAGYRTGMVGKWHLTRSGTIDDGPNGSWPLERGFDHFFGSMEGAKNYFQPKWFFDDEREITEFEDDFFYTDALSDRACEFIKNDNEPFFLYVAFYAPHFPLQAPAEDIEKFRGTYAAGWESIRAARFQRQLESGVVPSGTSLSPPDDNIPGWDTLSNAQRDELDHRMAVYAAQVHRLDAGVGRIIETLRESGQLENTLIMFCSDNGGQDGDPLGDGMLTGDASSAVGVRYGRGWSNVSNTPYQLYKGKTREGGIRTPFIISWPENGSENGTLNQTPAHLIDIASTCFEAAGVSAPESIAGRPVKPVEGFSLLGALGREATVHRDPRSSVLPPMDRPIYFEHEGWKGMRAGNWKIVSSKRRNPVWQLFDIENDRTETNDVAESYPEVLSQLVEQWYSWAEHADVLETSSRTSRSPRGPPQGRPNVVWIVADDLSPDLGCYGTIAVSTPNIDQLAAHSIRYTNAFCTSPVCSPSRTALVTGIHQSTIGGHHHRTRNRPDLAPGSTVMEMFREAGYFTSIRGKTDYNFNSEFKFDGGHWREREEGQPFFAQFHIKEPHRGFVRENNADRRANLELPPFYPDHPLVRADWANYLASIEVLDRKVGNILEQLEEDGLTENTIVIFFGDHGRPHVRDKQFLYDGGINVPLLVSLPEEVGGGETDARLVSLIDIAPTCLTLCGLDVIDAMQGVDFLSDQPERSFVVAGRDRSGDQIDRMRCVRTERFKYIRNYHPELSYTGRSSYKLLSYPVETLMQVLNDRGELNEAQSAFMAATKPAEELYDLVNDPDELTNLAGDRSNADILLELSTTLDNWEEQTDDLGRQPEGTDEWLEDSVIKGKRDDFFRRMRRRGFERNYDPEDYLNWWLRELEVVDKG
ncbi:MAG: sulfatase-like hydrolase/transferase [Planctomycetota bacterium]